MSDRLPVQPVPPESPAAPAADLARAWEEIGRWGVDVVAAGVSGPEGILGTYGPADTAVPIASITKLLVAWAVLLGLEEGAVALEDPLGPPGATVAHLLSHASGWNFEGDAVLAPPATRRIYSNRNYDELAAHLQRCTGIPFAEYLGSGVLEPLGMTATELRGPASMGGVSTVADLLLFAEEMRRPRILDPSTAATACTPHWGGLSGVLPGWGRMDPCPWGLGPEIRGTKWPHWTGATSPPQTFGHFGGSGTFLWLDPLSGVALTLVGTRAFGPWAVEAWPRLSDLVRVGVGLA